MPEDHPERPAGNPESSLPDNESVDQEKVDQTADQPAYNLPTVDRPSPGGDEPGTWVLPAETKAIEGASTVEPRRLQASAPGRIADYEIQAELGRGGMGVVYRAKQVSAGRTVALKVVRPDRLASMRAEDRAAVLERFQAEAQAAAQLEHDHLVTVYDVGESDGKWFYSMRFVDGQSLAELLRDGPLENLRVARYLEPVARALHEAHEHGVLHRDLKPHNIMIDARGDRALVADFGLAKLLEGESSATETGDLLGSPPYMSPEQTRDASTVTAAADVYGLGATLYHAITGRPPFQASSLAAVIRNVNETEPLAPRLLNPAVDAELETICLKCLEKEPLRRYRSAADLADELLRYREGKPIHARPIGYVGRTARWARRNPLVATLSVLTTVLLIAVLVGGAAAYVNLRQAFQSTETALAEANTERNRALEATAAAQREADRANNNLNLAYASVVKSLETINLSKELEQSGLQPLRKSLLEPSVGFLEQLVQQTPTNAQFRADQGQALYHLSHAYAQTGDMARAIAAAGQSADLFGQLRSETPDELDYSKRWIAARLLRADHLQRQQQFREAVGEYQAALKLQDELLQVHTDDVVLTYDRATTLSNLAVVYVELSRPSDAVDNFRRSIEQRQALLEAETELDRTALLVNLAITSENMGNALSQLRKVDEAEEAYTESNRRLQEAIESGGDSVRLRRQLGTQQYNLALLHYNNGRPDRAEALAQEAIKRFERLMADQPNLPEFPLLRATTLQLLGHALHDQAKTREAIAAAEKSVAQAGAVFARLKVPPVAAQLAKSLGSRAIILVAAGENQKGIASYRQEIQLYRDVLLPSATDDDVAVQYAQAHRNLGLAQQSLGEQHEAVTSFRTSLDSLAKLDEANSEASGLPKALADTRLSLATALLEIGELQQSRQLHQTLTNAPGTDDAQQRLHDARVALLDVNLMRAEEKPEQAAERIGRVYLDATRLDKTGNTAIGAWEVELQCAITRAELLEETSQADDAHSAWIETAGLAQRMLGLAELPVSLKLDSVVATAKAASSLASEPSYENQVERFSSRLVASLSKLSKEAQPSAARDFREALQLPAMQRLKGRDDFQAFLATEEAQRLLATPAP